MLFKDVNVRPRTRLRRVRAKYPAASRAGTHTRLYGKSKNFRVLQLHQTGGAASPSSARISKLNFRAWILALGVDGGIRVRKPGR
mmetsp:Transcript_21565/g.34063  ORF Transcript_21565/g.34063 Transcript_21565/m.34063 type:complete len:85 (-) Transcript_21565:585-839(-)